MSLEDTINTDISLAIEFNFIKLCTYEKSAITLTKGGNSKEPFSAHKSFYG